MELTTFIFISFIALQVREEFLYDCKLTVGTSVKQAYKNRNVIVIDQSFHCFFATSGIFNHRRFTTFANQLCTVKSDGSGRGENNCSVALKNFKHLRFKI